MQRKLPRLFYLLDKSVGNSSPVLVPETSACIKYFKSCIFSDIDSNKIYRCISSFFGVGYCWVDATEVNQCLNRYIRVNNLSHIQFDLTEFP